MRGRRSHWVLARQEKKEKRKARKNAERVQDSWCSWRGGWGNRQERPYWQEGAIGGAGGYNGDGPVHDCPSFYRRHANGASRLSVRTMCSGTAFLDVVGGQMNDIATTRRALTKHNSC